MTTDHVPPTLHGLNFSFFKPTWKSNRTVPTDFQQQSQPLTKILLSKARTLGRTRTPYILLWKYKKGFILIVTLGVDSFVVWWPAFLFGTLLALWYFLSFIYHLSNFTFLRLSPIWEFFSSFNNNKKWDCLPFRKSLGCLLFSFEFIFKYSKRWL